MCKLLELPIYRNDLKKPTKLINIKNNPVKTDEEKKDEIIKYMKQLGYTEETFNDLVQFSINYNIKKNKKK